ncbi:hypothetical protein PORY_000770 [Pneumocystis oryctolagi]|uniref:Uncharacterized protein n=1 Tax=Pneumocystis oryctolagi TaxID=42067 RepID=A0ACB7CFL6_9ASCO|nr:hypothetical protein PORY_000770 [Pneumocystis oryctolagi]
MICSYITNNILFKIYLTKYLYISHKNYKFIDSVFKNFGVCEVVLMINLKTILSVVDNSGAQLAECINVLKSGKYAKIGDEIVVVIQKARSSNASVSSSNMNKIQRGDIKHALVVRTKKETRRKDGRYIVFDDNACILINKKEPIGTRILGAVPAELKYKGWSKVISLAQKVTWSEKLQRIHSYVFLSNDKISKLVDQISGLTLKETSDLVSRLKTCLNIQDIRPVVAPVTMPTSEKIEEEKENKEEEKHLFNVILESYDAAAKAKVIKEIKLILGLNLVDAKKFVESSPKMLKEGIGREEADKIKKTLEDLGAKVSLN